MACAFPTGAFHPRCGRRRCRPRQRPAAAARRTFRRPLPSRNCSRPKGSTSRSSSTIRSRSSPSDTQSRYQRTLVDPPRLQTSSSSTLPATASSAAAIGILALSEAPEDPNEAVSLTESRDLARQGPVSKTSCSFPTPAVPGRTAFVRSSVRQIVFPTPSGGSNVRCDVDRVPRDENRLTRMGSAGRYQHGKLPGHLHNLVFGGVQTPLRVDGRDGQWQVSDSEPALARLPRAGSCRRWRGRVFDHAEPAPGRGGVLRRLHRARLYDGAPCRPRNSGADTIRRRQFPAIGTELGGGRLQGPPNTLRTLPAASGFLASADTIIRRAGCRTSSPPGVDSSSAACASRR